MGAGRTLLDYLPGKGEWEGGHSVVECRRALTPLASIPSVGYALNPYGGCAHGCVYCPAIVTTHSDPSSWTTVRVKADIARRLARELPAVEGAGIAVGTTTDPYQYAERRFMLTRSCLEIMRPGRNRVLVMTRSDLVARDADLLLDLGALVLVNVTCIDGAVSKALEPGAPSPGARLDAVRRLVSEGVDVAVAVSPATTYPEGSERELAESISATGARRVFTDVLGSKRMGPGPVAPFMSEDAAVVLRRELGRLGIECGPLSASEKLFGRAYPREGFEPPSEIGLLEVHVLPYPSMVGQARDRG